MSRWACFASGLDTDDLASALRATDSQAQRALAQLLCGARPVADDPDQFSLVAHDVIAALKVAQKQQKGDGVQKDANA